MLRTVRPLPKPVVAKLAAQTSVQLRAAEYQLLAERPNRKSGSHAQVGCHRGDGGATETRQARDDGDDVCNDAGANPRERHSRHRVDARVTCPAARANRTTPAGKSLRSKSSAQAVGVFESQRNSRKGSQHADGLCGPDTCRTTLLESSFSENSQSRESQQAMATSYRPASDRTVAGR